MGQKASCKVCHTQMHHQIHMYNNYSMHTLRSVLLTFVLCAKLKFEYHISAYILKPCMSLSFKLLIIISNIIFMSAQRALNRAVPFLIYNCNIRFISCSACVSPAYRFTRGTDHRIVSQYIHYFQFCWLLVLFPKFNYNI